MDHHKNDQEHAEPTTDPDEQVAGSALSDDGVGLGAGTESTFEPEEDPSSVPDDPA